MGSEEVTKKGAQAQHLNTQSTGPGFTKLRAFKTLVKLKIHKINRK